MLHKNKIKGNKMTIKLLSTGGLKNLKVGEIYTVRKVANKEVISCNWIEYDLKLYGIEYLRRC